MIYPREHEGTDGRLHRDRGDVPLAISQGVQVPDGDADPVSASLTRQGSFDPHSCATSHPVWPLGKMAV